MTRCLYNGMVPHFGVVWGAAPLLRRRHERPACVRRAVEILPLDAKSGSSPVGVQLFAEEIIEELKLKIKLSG